MATQRGAAKRAKGSPAKRAAGTHASARREAPTAKKSAGTAKRSGTRSVHAVTPYLTVADAAASIAFYERAFGFKPGVVLSAPDGAIIHVAMKFKGAPALMFSPAGVSSGSMQTPAHSGADNPITLHVRCSNVDALAKRARAAGAAILTEPEDMFWGERIARIADPDGYIWCFARRTGEFDPAKVPAPASEDGADAGFDFDL